MKVCIIQPAYSTDYAKSEEYFNAQIALIDKCDESMDIIVLPESADIPCLAKTREDAMRSSARFTDAILAKASETAKRCHAIVFVNARSYEESENGRNTTYAFDRTGKVVGKYFKQHLTPGEVSKMCLDSEYTYEFSEPTVLEIEGLRFAFLTCYDIYFYEAYAHIARKNVDIVIGCSHQRSDTHRALEILSQNLAYNTNAYVLRSSVSMDESSDIGGASMVVAPNGEILLHMRSRVGLETVEIDPHAKYYKPAGFGNPPAAHYEYIEAGRRPWKYRPAGSAIVRNDASMPYPRVCADGGFSSLAPKNSLAAFGAAVALGAQEIAVDLWFTKDGEAVALSSADIAGGKKAWETSLDALRAMDLGAQHGERFAGMKVPTLEDILKKLSCHCAICLRMHTDGASAEALEKLMRLIKKYDCEEYVCFASGDALLLARLQKLAPKSALCYDAEGATDTALAEAARLECKKILLRAEALNLETVAKAHEGGLICYAACMGEGKDLDALLALGVDAILTGDCHRAVALIEQKKKHTMG